MTPTPPGAGPLSYLTDALGSTVALAGPSGGLSSEYSYEPFGRASQTGGDTNSFQYTGRENDGTGLYYYRARYYHPTLQRFIGEDPLEFTGGQANLYAYVANSPVLWSDPLGLKIDWGNYVLSNPYVISNLYRLNQEIVNQGLPDDSFTLKVTGGDRYLDCARRVRSSTDFQIVPGASSRSPHLIENGARAVDLRVTGVSNARFDQALRNTDFNPRATDRNYPDRHTHIALPPGRDYDVPPDSLPNRMSGRKDPCGL